MQEAKRRAEQGALLVDVREQGEWDEARIPGAVLVPLGEVAARLDELPRDRDLVVFCRSGGRSARATRYLLDQGRRAVNVAGGIMDWAKAGYDLERGPEDDS